MSAFVAVAGWSAALLAALGALAIAHAQSTGGNYVLERQSIAAGGGRSTAGGFALEGSIAQHDASNAIVGAEYEVTGGFHARARVVAVDAIFGNGFEGL